jgi:hypothetical protein
MPNMSGKAGRVLSVLAAGALIIAAPARAQNPPNVEKSLNPLNIEQCQDVLGQRFSTEARIGGCTAIIPVGLTQRRKKGSGIRQTREGI